ncbi:hypothetical protein SCH4B_3468 [Ruegeria sp. TrichCH4B]|nr:hypothetical protein SCH4B_3468 [Ruegeria sp. TrichCH4B]
MRSLPSIGHHGKLSRPSPDHAEMIRSRWAGRPSGAGGGDSERCD